MFFSSKSPDELPRKGDRLIFEGQHPCTVLKRVKAKESGSVLLDVKDDAGQVHELQQVEAFKYLPEVGDIVVVSIGRYKDWWIRTQKQVKKDAVEIEQSKCNQNGLVPTTQAVEKTTQSLLNRRKLRTHLLALDVYATNYGSKSKSKNRYRDHFDITEKLYQKLKILSIDGSDMAIVVTEKGEEVPALPVSALDVSQKHDGRKA